MLQVLGRLHPVLVHFPIALLLAALAAELLRPRKDGPSEAGFFCLALGVLGAWAAAASGWLFAAHDAPGAPELLERHRWSGIGATVAASVTWLSAWRWRRGGAAALARPTRVGLVLTAILAGLSGHLGGEMVYGEGFALEPLRRTPRAPEPPTDGARDAPPVPTAAADSVGDSATASVAPPVPTRGVDFLVDVRPILERRCFECHGDRKRPKGDLRLTDMAAVLARDPSVAALVPGDPAASLLFQRITLPVEHEDVMPPEGGPLPSEEIETIRRWIAAGAPWEAPAPPGGPATGGSAPGG